MGTDIHARHQDAGNRSHPPAGRNDDDTHALQAGRDGPSQRKSARHHEQSTRDAGSDDRRSGSETGKPDR